MLAFGVWADCLESDTRERFGEINRLSMVQKGWGTKPYIFVKIVKLRVFITMYITYLAKDALEKI